MYVSIDVMANEYALDRTSSARSVLTVCRRQHIKDLSDCVHDETATMYSHNMFRMSVVEKSPNVKSIVMYLTARSFFGANTMLFVMDKMLHGRTVDDVLMYSDVLQNNFYMHPPCAKYMAEEYRRVMLVPSDEHFDRMAFWDFLIDRLHKIADGSCSYGDNAGADMGFKKCFAFCMTVLQFDYDVSYKNKVGPLVKKCLNYNPDRLLKMGGLRNMLNMLFDTKCDLQTLAISLAVLTKHI